MNTPLLTKQMDASNEFCFISAPSGLKKKSKKRVGDEAQDSDLRNVPVCVTSTNRNVKLRFVWDKAFKLFHSHRPVYKAMSGINYQDYGTGGSSSRKSGAGSCGTGTSFSSSCVGGGRRSRSQSQLSDFEDSEILDLNLKPIPIKKSSGASKTSRGKEKRPWSISGGEKPEGEDDDVNGKEGSSGTGSRRPALANCNLTSKCNVNNGPNGSHHASCTPPSEQVGNISTCGGGVAHPLRRSRSSCMSSTGASATGEGKWKVHEDNQEHQSNFASSSGGRKSNSWARTGSISPEEDSGLDTWKSPRQGSGRIGGSSIVCTIGQRAKHGIEDGSSSSCGSMMRENPTGNTTVVLIAPRENEDLDLSTSTTTDFFVELDDIECMSEIDLTSEAGSGTLCELEDSIEDLVGLGAVGEDKEKMKLKTAANMTTSHSHLPYHPENEFDSLDLTLFEKESEGIGMTESERYFFQMQMIQGFSLESDSDHIYDTVAMEDGDDGRNSRVMGGSDTLSVWNWSDAGSEFEFMSPATQQATELTKTPATSNSNREIPLGHSPRGQAPEVEWEPYFCVLNQLDQTFTSYRSEEMSFADNGASPAEVPRIRLDGGPSSIKCLINNSKWGMNPVLEEEEGETTMSNGTEKGGRSSDISSSGSGSNQRNSSPASPLDTSYDKACGNDGRRSSAPLTPLLGRETPSRFANFFSKRSFKSNPLKRTKSVTKLERKKVPGIDTESVQYSTQLRTSRSHESLLAWSNHSVSNFVNNGMMSTMDLASGDIAIRPLHPSILSQEYGFQIVTPTNGSKYYTCSSTAERDSWVHALRQAIKPHADEIRRLENSLKIWILEAKGVGGGSGKHSSSKKYFCELYLDDVLYARTCGKPRADMLFWGEHFEFTQLPNCVQEITIVFFREGDKKRKKERNTCIGKVKIPVNTVNSRYLIEKWYPVLPDSVGSQKDLSSKDKDTPSLRVKCKYQSVDILPLRCYKPFIQYMKDQYGPVSECLESVLSVKAKEDLASAMVHVLHHEGLAKEFIAELALQEILKNGDEKLTFRGNSIATKAMEAFLKLTGAEYLQASLGSFIEKFQSSEDLYDCEIDPMKIQQSSNLTKNQQNLRMAVDTVWKSILHSHAIFPIELRECFAHCREALRSAGRDELSDHLISASIFLRFLCPAILSPSLFNITNEYPTEKSARNLTMVAKVLQTLANFTRFQGKENYMEFINDFVEKEAPNMKAFLLMISTPLEEDNAKRSSTNSTDSRDSTVPPGGFIDFGKHLSILSTLLSESVSKIAPKNDRFKQLQDILETIHNWLKQPANATNVSLFPFPHLASPPPNGPPPPAPSVPLGIPVSSGNRTSIPINGNPALNHQYQVPVHLAHSGTPIYAVSNVIHNTSNPNVKNITQVNMNKTPNMNMITNPLQLQIPHLIMNNNQRSGSQASSGYQSQSPVLEGEDKAKKINFSQGGNEILHGSEQVPSWNENRDINGRITPLNFNNPGFNRKNGSLSVDDLSLAGVENGQVPNIATDNQRASRSSSSSDCEYASSTVGSSRRQRLSQKKVFPQSHPAPFKPHGKVKPSTNVQGVHTRLSRRSSAELLRKNHPYSSSTDEDSDSGHVNDNEMENAAPQLPPRRSNAHKRSSGTRPNPDGSNGEKTLEEVRHSIPNSNAGFGINPLEYEREMMELRRAMEALQVKLNRAEERLFGHDSPGHSRRESDVGISTQIPTVSVGCDSNRSSRYVEENTKEMEQLLQRLLSAEEEMKREQELLSALDKKQKLIDVQEQKIARLDAVNNQLLSALSQIRDSLQQQHVQQQQQKIQHQLQKQQQHLQSLANGMIPNNRNSSHLRATHNYLNSNHNNVIVTNGLGVIGPDKSVRLQLNSSPRHSLVQTRSNNNTTKVLITSEDSSGNVSPDSLDNNTDANSNKRDSSVILGEQALKMLADLKSSAC